MKIINWIKEHPYRTSFVIGITMLFGGLVSVIPWCDWTFVIIGSGIILFTGVLAISD